MPRTYLRYEKHGSRHDGSLALGIYCKSSDLSYY